MKKKLAALILGAGIIVGIGVIGTADRWMFAALDPGEFDPSSTPPAPNYQEASAWAALPSTRDGADVSLPELPAIEQATASASVFYLHPTTWVGKAWNGPTDAAAVVEATERGATLIQASAFNSCCAIFAPRYRQANGGAYTQPTPAGEKAIKVAFDDVTRAFERFLSTTKGPFFIAGHSQGAILGAKLLKERVAGSAAEARLVAAYLPGSNARPGDVGIPICAHSAQTGCVAVWNARGPNYEPNDLELDAANPDTMEGRICVNPITWESNGDHAPAAANPGAVFFDTPTPKVKPAFADAQCRDGTLVVTKLGDLERDMMSRILLWMMGPENYHPVEYQLFYVGLRANAEERLAAFKKRGSVD